MLDMQILKKFLYLWGLSKEMTAAGLSHPKLKGKTMTTVMMMMTMMMTMTGIESWKRIA